MKQVFKRYYLVLLFIAGLFSCDSEVCDQQHAQLQISFYKLTFPEAVPTVTAPDFKFTKIYVNGKEALFPKDIKLKNLGFPLPLDRDSIEIIFVKDTIRSGATVSDSVKRTDTLKLAFKRNMSFISHECGFTTQYDSIKVQRSTFDFIEVRKTFINKTNEQNIKVYYHYQ